MKINPINIQNLSTITDLVRFLNPFCQQISNALTSNLNFQDNFKANTVVVNFGSTISQQIAHNLNTTPIGYLPIRTSTAGIIYDGSSLVLGATFVNLRCNVAGTTATILFF